MRYRRAATASRTYFFTVGVMGNDNLLGFISFSPTYAGWEHQIRNEDDLARHVEYIHYNPVKHGLVSRPADWPHSTLHGYIERGMLTPDWGVSADDEEHEYGER